VRRHEGTRKTAEKRSSLRASLCLMPSCLTLNLPRRSRSNPSKQKGDHLRAPGDEHYDAASALINRCAGVGGQRSGRRGLYWLRELEREKRKIRD